MPTSYAEFSQIVRRLCEALLRLERACGTLQLPTLVGREWFELLTKKLLPQLTDDAFLVVAVVGGTNIGKSVIFNHIAGFRASATSPLASGTKHPVCLVPVSFSSRHNLPAVFAGFHLQEWTNSEAPLHSSDEDLLFWQERPETPENLLVLDTPDVDSDAPVNWLRADAIRRCADVLIAVLTQQKYNDAAVKQFFRKAAAEDKAVVVVFNQCQLPEDEEYWPLWLDTFCRETGIEPEYVYIAPNDRRAAEANRLAFYERPWPLNGQPVTQSDEPGVSLMNVLSQLHFADIKLRTLRGSLNHLLNVEEGVPAYLAEVHARSGEFLSAAELLAAHKLAQIDDWPPVPNPVLIAEIRRWWQARREGWSARVHGFYNAVGSGLAWPVRFVRERLQGEQIPPLEAYRRREWETVVTAVGAVYDKLTWISELGNELLRPRLEQLLAGTSRVELLRKLEEEHARVDLERELQDMIAREMSSFREESPQYYTFLKRLDALAAAARPATSIVLFVAGFGPAGHVVPQMIGDAAVQTAIHFATDLAGGTVAAAVGDRAISQTAATGMGYLEAKFRGMQSAFLARRAAWLASMLKQHLLGTLPEELQAAAQTPQSAAYGDVRTVLGELRTKLTEA